MYKSLLLEGIQCPGISGARECKRERSEMRLEDRSQVMQASQVMLRTWILY